MQLLLILMFLLKLIIIIQTYRGYHLRDKNLIQYYPEKNETIYCGIIWSFGMKYGVINIYAFLVNVLK